MRLLITILLLSVPHLLSATNYYISTTDGNDSRTSTQAQSSSTPWASITRLNIFIGSLVAGDTVKFKRGDVFYGTIALPSSGSTWNDIAFADYGTGAKPIINGFTTLPSWTESSPGSHNWGANVNSGLNLDLVVVGPNDSIVAMGRTPNLGSYFNIYSRTTYTGGTPGFPDDDPQTGTITSTDVPVGTQNWTGGIIKMRTADWSFDGNRITGHSSNTLTFLARSGNVADSGNKFFIQGHPATLDQQYEWYYDPVNHIIRMYSTSNPNTFGVKVATQDFLFNASSSRSNIAFINLAFTGADSLAIRVYQSNRIKVKYCDFLKIGNDGFSAFQGETLTIDSCTFTDMGNSGIVSRYATDIYARGNTILRAGIIEGMGLSNNQQRDGIMIENAGADDSVVITGNNLQYVGYCGIRFTGTKTLISKNYVNQYCLQLSDGGGIYGNGEMNLASYRVIEDNIIENGHGNHKTSKDTTSGGVPGIYLDDRSGNGIIRRNTIRKATRYGIFLHNAQKVSILENTILETNGDAAIGIVHDGLGAEVPSRDITIKYNFINSPASKDMIFVFSYDYDDIDSLGLVDSNYYSRPAAGNILTYDGPGAAGGNYTLASWSSNFGFDSHSTMQAIPADSIRFEYNNTLSNSVAGLGANTYLNLKKQAYTSNITMLPFSSLLLYKHALQKTYLPVRFKTIQQ